MTHDEGMPSLSWEELLKDPLLELPMDICEDFLDSETRAIGGGSSPMESSQRGKGGYAGGSDETRWSPTSSESGNLGKEQGDKSGSVKRPTGESSQTTPRNESNRAKESQKQSQAEEDEAKRLARMKRNRENAYLSRQRKKQQFQQLQAAVARLQTQNSQLTLFVQRLTAENCLLRHHLANACGKANISVPDVPSSLQSMATSQQPQAANASIVPRGPVGSHQPSTNSNISTIEENAAAGPVGQSGLPSVVVAPKVQHDSCEQRSMKRRRISGAGAALLALFSVFMFASPFIPAPSGSPISGLLTDRPNYGNQVVGLLPMGSMKIADNEAIGGRQGRALMQVNDGFLDQVSGKLDDKECARRGHISNETLESLLHDPKFKALPEMAFKSLQELAPAAVLLSPDAAAKEDDDAKLSSSKDSIQEHALAKRWEHESNSRDPMAASVAFPVLASHIFDSAGLASPQTCEKVFEFSASDVSHPRRSRQSVERYILSSYGFKGRSAGLKMPVEKIIREEESSTRREEYSLKIGPHHHPTKRTVLESSDTLSESVSMPSSVMAADSDDSGADVVVEEPVLASESRDHLLRDHIIRDSEYIAEYSDASDYAQHDMLLPHAVDEPLVVSLLVPSNLSDEAKGSHQDSDWQAVDRVFIVMLHPQDRFVTYSCGLTKPFLM